MGEAPYLKGLDTFKNLDWGRSYLWDCTFGPGKQISPTSLIELPGSPFNTWFPATEVRENLATVSSKEFEGYMSTYKVPQSTSFFPIELTFIDDWKETLAQWLADWMNKKILGDGKYLYPLEEVVAPLYIAKLGPDKQPLAKHGIRSYIVYPEGEIHYEGASENGLHKYTVTFVSVGSVL